MTKIQKEWKPLRALVLNIRAFFKKRNHKKKKRNKTNFARKKAQNEITSRVSS
jgi:hypothetical protein